MVCHTDEEELETVHCKFGKPSIVAAAILIMCELIVVVKVSAVLENAYIRKAKTIWSSSTEFGIQMIGWK